MAVPLSSLIRPRRGPSLAALERLAPAPADELLAAEIESRTLTGDIVLELHGRGGWVARKAVDRLRRVYSLESCALTALMAELVLRPPDLRHLDAAFTALANAPRGRIGLRDSIAAGFASSCPDCGNPVRVEEFIWDAEAGQPIRRVFRCGHCRSPRGDGRPVPVAEEDLQRARAFANTPGATFLRDRFPVPDASHPLPNDLLRLYPARALDGLAAIIERIETDLRAPSIQAALRLAFVHTLVPASRLNSYPGRVGTLKVVNGRVKLPGGRQFRERDPWTLFEEGCRAVRAFVQRLDSPVSHLQTRYGRDLGALLDGSANVVLRQGNAADAAVAPRLPGGRVSREDSRVTLVLTQPPIHWSGETLAFAYLSTAMALGYDAAATLPLEALFGSTPRGEWAWDAAALRRSMAAARSVLAPEGQALLVLDATGPGGLVAGVLGGVGAGFRLTDALLTETGDEITGILEFSPPDAPIREGDRAFPTLGSVDPTAPFSLKACERAVTEIAVAILQARGEPTRGERLLGEVLIGLDRMGHLARLVGTGGRVEVDAGLNSDRPAAAAAGPRATGLFGDLPASDGAAWSGAGDGAADPPSAMGAPRAVAVPVDPGFAAGPTGGTSPGAAPAPASGASWRDPARNVRAQPALPRWAQPPSWSREPTIPGNDGTDAYEPVALPDAGDEPFAGVLPPRPIPGLAPADLPPASARPLTTASASPSAAAPVARTPAAAMAASERIVAWGDEASSADPVRLTLDVVMKELRRPDHPRLEEVEPGRWWLRDPEDAEGARPPLADRVEWAVFSLLSTAGGISEAAFFDRIATMFRGHDTPDEELVRACLDSYRTRDRLPDAPLTTDEALQARFEEHGQLVGRIAEFGQSLGLRTWISRREQRRRYRDRTLADLLTDVEQRVFLPLVHPGPSEALEGIDCIWYLRGKVTFLWEVEWTAMLDEPLLRRGGRIPTTDSLVRFLVIPPERTELVRLKLARSAVLRRALEEGNWHIVKADHLERLLLRPGVGLEDLAPLLGLDPEIEKKGEQLPLFG
ncbi:MAG: hypothetical protein U0869_01940 [Chloroflexota bacterium]